MQHNSHSYASATTHRCLGLGGAAAAADVTLECSYRLTGTAQLYDASLGSSTCINTQTQTDTV